MSFGNYEVARLAAEWIALAAVVVITLSVAFAALSALVEFRKAGLEQAFAVFRRRMGRGLLIGLDLLIAADIIESVTVEPTLDNILGLGLLVLIRTFLSWAIFLEIEERWPWQKRPADEPAGTTGSS